MRPPIDPILVELGTVNIYWYGILVVVGILLGTTVAAYLAKRAGHNPEIIWDMLFVSVILGVIGGRIDYIATQPHWSYYSEHLPNAFYIWEGGLRIYGAILGGAVGIVIYALVKRLNPLTYLDFATPGAAIGMAIGRWGNFVNMELYGPPTTLPWGLDIPVGYRVVPYHNLAAYPETTRFHPTFLYESVLDLAICLVLIWLAAALGRRLKAGDIALAFLGLYSGVRFGLDFLRTDGTSTQTLSLVLLGLAILGLALRHLLVRKAATPEPR